MPAKLVVIVGCMFSGKTEDLLRRLNLERIARKRTVVCKPVRDTRSADVCSRDGRTNGAVLIADPVELLTIARDYDSIGLDEIQFFPATIADVVRQLYAQGKRVFVAGLDTDFRGMPFGPSHLLMAIPEAEIVRQHAVCMRCGGEATRSHRTIPADAQVVIGDTNEYEALCFPCYQTATARDGVTVAVPAAVVAR